MTDRLLTVREVMERLPVAVAERRFRETARALGLNRLDGRQMMVRPEDVDTILQAMTPCSKSSVDVDPLSGRLSEPSKVNASGKALARLIELQRKTKRPNSTRV